MFRLRGCFWVRVSTCLFIFTLCGRIIGALNEPVKVVVREEDDVILPCSLSTKENIESKLFDWKKDGQKEVFMYDAGLHYNNQPSDAQDRQFKGHVFHFQDELKHGNASIIIRNTKVADSGNYTCIFPRLQPRQIFHIELVVDGILRDRRVVNFPGAASEPSVTILNQTKDGMKLQCVVQGVSPKPKLEWKDGSGNIVPAKDPQVTERGDVILQATVRETDLYQCVITQKEIYHQIDSKIFVHINEKTEKISQGAPTGQIDPTGWIVAAVFGILLVVAVVVIIVLQRKRFCKKGSTKNPPLEGETHPMNSSDSPQTSGLK